jgi:hypothetical protein
MDFGSGLDFSLTMTTLAVWRPSIGQRRSGSPRLD